ncbi:MAG TPA: long-chain fatty acid--CoA ligase [Solirubrobacteraceae bacterium]|nr:long-chain fatty acid--CoA ligase [Solirubrobacteraceae bacterium]
MREGLMMDDHPLSLAAIVQRAETFSPDRAVAFRRPDGTVGKTTLGKCAARAHLLAGALRELGVGPGDVVGTLLWNQPEHLELYLALPAMGAVIHTLNPRLSAEELGFIIADAGDRVLVVDGTLLPVLEAIEPACRPDRVVVVRHDAGAAAASGDPGAAAASPEPGATGRGQQLGPGHLDYEQLLSGAQPLAWSMVPERAAAAMCYTSGTTGRPKGVLYSHRALVLHSICAALPDATDVSARDTVLPVVPMFHVNAWGMIYTAALVGAGLVLPGPRLDAVSILELLSGERVTITAGVPTVWMAVLQALDAEPDRWDLRALRALMVGGSAVPESLLAGFDRHGLRIVQAWGMTETSPLASVCRLPAELEDAPASERYAYRARQGRPLPLVEIRARGEDGRLIEWDDVAMGELEVRGPWVARAYHSGAGADRFTDDGWFRTGDVVRIDRSGNLRICDRAKDLVKSGGEWISSVDMENLLMAHDAVAEAAVIAVPDERWGERPLAVVALHPGMAADADELRAHLSRGFARWQLPDRFEFVEAIPRTATGKFKKTALREMFASGGASAPSPARSAAAR